MFKNIEETYNDEPNCSYCKHYKLLCRIVQPNDDEEYESVCDKGYKCFNYNEYCRDYDEVE